MGNRSLEMRGPSFGLLAILVIAGCGTASPDRACVPGVQVACACPGGGAGAQACAADGGGYETCICSGSPDADVAAQDLPGDEASAAEALQDEGLAGDVAGGEDVPGTDEAGAEVAPAPCDMVAQTGCGAGERCAWIRDQVDPKPSGAPGCVAEGTADVNGPCSYGATGTATGFDNCRKGLTCLATYAEQATGVCRAVCDLTAAPGSSGACVGPYVCGAYSDFLGTGPQTVGLCDPTCDPLTQQRLADGAPYCGGTAGPSLGCYGGPSVDPSPSHFICAKAGPATNVSDTACDQNGMCFLNGCAPGFLALLHASNSDPTPICVALCEPGDTSQAAPGNAQGKVGSGHTCPDAGAGGTHECRYWRWLEGADTPVSSFSAGLGFCMDYTKYLYDSNGDQSLDAAYPSCTTLSATGHTFSDAVSDTQYWGCEATP